MQWRRSPYSMLVQHAAYSVDTFFFLSGLLMVVIALRAMERYDSLDLSNMHGVI